MKTKRIELSVVIEVAVDEDMSIPINYVYNAVSTLTDYKVHSVSVK